MGHYSSTEEQALLRIARAALTAAVLGRAAPALDLATLPPALREPRACFVTLHCLDGSLRGCTGVLMARQSLAEEVSQTAVQTAFNDPRFAPVCPAELPEIVIELSVLTVPEPLAYETPAAIPDLLQPFEDGVILMVDGRRATFLPQVWERAPEPVMFLDLLCHKMGLPPGAWSRAGVQVYTYRSVMIAEQPAEAAAAGRAAVE